MIRTALIALVALAAGCTTAPNGAEEAELYTQRTAAEEAGLVAFLQDKDVSTREVLDDDCAIRSDSAYNIDKYRHGNSDNHTIDSEAELDSIPMVGPWTIDQLYTCAEAFGYIQAESCDNPGWHIEYVYGDEEGNIPDTLNPGLVDVINDVTGHDWCGGYGDSWFVKATVDTYDCVEVGYTIELGQLVDEFHGLSYYIEFEVDDTFSWNDPICEL